VRRSIATPLVGSLLGLLLFGSIPEARSGEGEVTLLTDEAIPRYLNRGQQLARSGEWAKMIDILQRVVQGDATIFPELNKETLNSAVHTTDGILYYPARELCVQELSKLPPAALTIYRATYDVPAERIFKAAMAAPTLDQRIEKLTEVYDTYLVSSFGDDALDVAANLSLQLGRYFEALALYRRLLEVYPRDSDRDLVMARTKAAYCAARIGDSQTRDAILDQLIGENPGRRVRIEGKRIAVENLGEHPVMAVIGGVNLGGSEDWTVAGGDPSRQRIAEDIPEDMPGKPFWSYGLHERDSRFWAPFGKWGRRDYDRQRAVVPSEPTDIVSIAHYPTVRPVVHNGTVFYKDYAQPISRRLSTGSIEKIIGAIVPSAPRAEGNYGPQPLHRARPGTGLSGNSSGGSQYEMAYRWFDYGGSEIVATNDHLLVTQTTKGPTAFLRGRISGAAAPNVLFACRRSNGVILWAYDQSGLLFAPSLKTEPTQLEAWKRDHSRHNFAHFRGPGVVSGGILYTIVDEKDGPKDQSGGVSLWAMRIADGRVLYRTQLHHHDEIRTGLPGNASVAVAGAVAYVTTNAGIVAAVDALPPGRIRWIRRYERSFSAPGRGAQKRIFVRFTHNEPIVAGGKIIIAAPDGKFVEAIDAETGLLAWKLSSAELQDVHHIVGVRGQTLVLAGTSVCAVDIDKGKVIWSHEWLGKRKRHPYGRGFVSDKYVYIPATEGPKPTKGDESAVHRFDIVTGEPAGSFTFGIPRLGNILCIGGRLIAASENRISCFLSPKREQERLDALIEKRPDDFDLRIERAEFAMAKSPRDPELALDDLRKAHDLAKSDLELEGEASWRLIHLLLDEARRQKSIEPLEEAQLLAKSITKLQGGSPEQWHRPYEAQVALVKAELLAGTSRAEESLSALDRFVDEYAAEEVVIDDTVVGVRVAARRLRNRLLQNADFRAAFEASVRKRIEEAYAAKDIEALQAVPDHYGGQPPSEEAYFALARLHREQNRLGEAELALRAVLRDFPTHSRRAEAHLQLALVLANRKLVYDARRERDQGLALLDEPGRKQFAAEIAELGKLLPDAAPTVERPSLELPLRTHVIENPALEAISVSGKAPASVPPFTLTCDGTDYVAIGSDGKIRWKLPLPTGGGVDLGPPESPLTSAVAAAVARARLARFVDDDLLVADVHGMTRIDPATGKAIWTWPLQRKPARDAANSAVRKLRIHFETLARDGHLNRTSPLPVYLVRQESIVRVDPAAGVFAYTLGAGDLLWSDEQAKGELAGAPSLVGQLLAVGRASPGRIEIFDVVAGARVETIPAPGGERAVLLAAPKLDRLGRLYVIVGSDAKASSAAFHVLDTSNGKSLREPIDVHSRYAAVLHADGNLVVFHDGSSGGDNLHFLQLAAGRHLRIPTEDLARDVEVMLDGSQLFVFSHKAGVADEGARLFRIELSGRVVQRYERIGRALAFARPLLTRRFVVLVGSDARQARVRLYDREASKDLSPPAAVFPLLGGSRMSGERLFEPAAEGGVRYHTAPAVAASGKGLVISHPFGAFRLQAAAPR